MNVRWSKEMAAVGRCSARILLTTLVFCLVAACNRSQTQISATSNYQAENSPSLGPDYGELESISVKALNYTPWYIHRFSIMGPEGSDISGGGPNIMPAEGDNQPSGGGGGTCCLTYPRKWQPDLRLTVRWLADKKQDGKTPGYWYKAENVHIAQYGPENGSAWMIFLPGDRVRLMITDGNHDGGNNPNNRPSDDDPLVVKGALDDEWNQLYREGGNAQ